MTAAPTPNTPDAARVREFHIIEAAQTLDGRVALTCAWYDGRETVEIVSADFDEALTALLAQAEARAVEIDALRAALKGVIRNIFFEPGESLREVLEAANSALALTETRT